MEWITVINRILIILILVCGFIVFIINEIEKNGGNID